MDIAEIVQELNRRFALPLKEYYERHIIFWHDPEGEFAEEIDTLQLDNAKVLKLTGKNQFLTKKILSHDDLESNYLVYVPFDYESLEDNWLLDIEIASGSFRADLISMWMDEAKIPDELSYRKLLKQYRKFFNARERRQQFINVCEGEYTQSKIMLGMMAVLVKSKSIEVGDILRAVFTAGTVMEENEAYQKLESFNLTGVFWSMVRQITGYDEKDASNLSRLLLYLFVTAASRVLPNRAFKEIETLKGDGFETYAFDFISEWMHGVRKREFQPVAQRVEKALNFAHRLKGLSLDELGSFDLLPCVDGVVLERLLQDCLDNLVYPETIRKVCERRRSAFWYDEWESLYEGLWQYGNMLAFAEEHRTGFHLTNPREVWEAYTGNYYRMDSYYRKFHAAFAKTLGRNLPEVLDDAYKQLAEMVENHYTNDYLVQLGENWTKNIAHDLSEFGKIQEIPQQTDFYKTKVAGAKYRIFVVISDAMRYEVAATLADELAREIPSEVNLESCQSMFPSITKFGMAALLPHENLSVKLDGSGNLAVLADGQSTDAGNRDAILKGANPKSVALKASELNLMKRSERTAKVKGMEVVYIYHDTIDAASHTDDKKVFTACHETIDELKNLVHIIINEFGGTNIILTSDHGFLYTAKPLAEDSKAGSGLAKENIVELSRRYVITDKEAEADHLLAVNFMPENGDFKGFAPKEQIRLKVKGSGMNFVHGGVSLQEMVVPVLEFKHVRTDSAAFRKNREQYAMKPVQVRLLSSGHKVSNMDFGLNFYQVEAAGSGFVPANYDVYFTDAYDNAISDVQRIIADKVSPESTDRSFRCNFNLKAGDYRRSAQYFLVIQNADTNEVVQKVEFQIDTAFQKDEFNFME